MMNEENVSQFYLNCTNLTASDLKHANLSRGLAASVCVLIMIIMLAVLCCSKAYVSVIQRLFLYLILATILREICLVATLEHQFYYDHQEEVCAGLGFITHWSSTIVVFSASGVILYTILLVCVNTKCSNTSIQSIRAKVLAECIYLLAITLLPLAIAIVPLIQRNYGIAVAWCWIRALSKDCKDVGLFDQLALGYGIYEVVGVVGLIAMIGITITYCRTARESTRIRKLLLQSLVLTIFLLLYILVISIAFAIRVYSGITKWTQHYIMWVIHGAIIPLCHLIIPFGFLGSFYYRYFRNKCKQLKRSAYPASKYEALPGNKVPSSTFFEVPYTDEFTDIND